MRFSGILKIVPGSVSLAGLNSVKSAENVALSGLNGVNTTDIEPIEDFLADLFQKGLRLDVDGGKLKCRGPEEAVASAQADIRERKGEILGYLERRVSGQGVETIPAVSQRPERIPLSFAQQRLWFLQEMQPETGAYNVPFAVEIEGLFDMAAFRGSLEAVVERHEVFRTNFRSVDGDPVQEIASARPLEIDQLDVRGEGDVDACVKRAAVEHGGRPFDLANDPLLRVAVYRVADETFVVLFTVHHIAADAWSTDILLKELGLNYRARLLGKTAELPGLPIQYADFAIWQRDWLQGDVLEAQLDYWRHQLSGELPTLQLPTDFPRKRVQTFAGAVHNFSVPDEVTARLRAISQDAGASLFMTLLAGYQLLLRRYTGQEDILVGTPIANRHRPEVEGLIGLFVNTLVIRTRLRPQATFMEVLEEVRATTLGAQKHQDLPFEKLVETLAPDRDMSLSPLFQAKFRLENAPENEIDLPGLKLKRLPQAITTAKLDLSVDMYETPTGLVGGFEYNSDLFTAETIERMACHFVTLLGSIAAQPSNPLASLALLPQADEQRQRVEWNSRDLSFQDEACYHHLFEAQAARTPELPAVVFDGPDRAGLSYAKLNERANQLAHHLISEGVGIETVVAICLDRSVEMVVAMLGIMKAGGAYLPLDRAYPQERLKYLMTDSNAKVLVTSSDCELPEVSQRINLDATDLSAEPKDNPNVTITPANLAYLIYTSGTVGKPKGTLIPHGGLINLTEDKIRVCDIREGDCVVQFFSFSFDGSVPEFVMTLAAGAKLLMAPATTFLPGPEMRDLLKRNAVTHITLTPSALTALPHDEYPDLRMVLVGGEAPSPDLIKDWSPNRSFINAYGPTETTVNASMVKCGNGDSLEPTILPSTNKQLYVLDESLEIAPIGVVGELHIGGVGLARGYHHQPALTAERFIPNPFPPHPDRKHNIPLLYKTGDLASQLPDGRIRILGRVDQQTKIRGFRIELPEIERVLEQHPHVKTGLVRVRETASGDKRLLAYGVPESADHDTSAEVREHLAEKLPKFMLPSAFLWLDALPLTENGKLDEAALPLPEEAAPSARVEPKTDTEIKLAPIFEELLEIKDISTADNFFDLGGHSLLATRLVSKVMDTFGVEITVIDLFDAPTIARLAQRIDHKQQIQALMNTEIDDDDDREEIAL